MKVNAVDIVLLPDVAIHQKIVAIHKQLNTGDNEQSIALGDVCLPHLSLAMGGLKVQNREALFKTIEEIGNSFRGIKLHFDHISQHQNTKGENINSLEHQNNDTLKTLHQDIISETANLLEDKVTAEHFTGNEKPNQDSINWVNDYFEKHSLKNFNPHITLGTGVFDGNFEEFKAFFKRLAVCHLGNYCTCREILFETSLRG